MSQAATSDTPVLDLLGSMTAESMEASTLDAQTIMPGAACAPWSPATRPPSPTP